MRKEEKLVQKHTDKKWRAQDLNPHTKSKSHLLINCIIPPSIICMQSIIHIPYGLKKDSSSLISIKMR